jgi:hypothetical protein
MGQGKEVIIKFEVFLNVGSSREFIKRSPLFIQRRKK